MTDQSIGLWERQGRVPQSADKLIRVPSCCALRYSPLGRPGVLMRFSVLGSIDGDRRIGDVLDRINTVERIVNQRIVVKETRKKWTVTVTDDEAVAAQRIASRPTEPAPRGLFHPRDRCISN